MLFRIFLTGLAALCLAACQAQPVPAPQQMPTPLAPAPSGMDLEQPGAAAGFAIRRPAFLPEGYRLADTTLHEATHSVCLQYRHASEEDAVLLIAQGAAGQAPALEGVPGWPDYTVFREAAVIGGAQNALQLSGWRRPGWGCSEIAAGITPRYSFALAPQFAWEQDGQLFELYSASAGCGTPAGVTRLGLLRVAEGLTGSSTHAAQEPDPQCLRTLDEVDALLGGQAPRPGYLPADTAFYYATLETGSETILTLHFLHLQHSAMGSFFRVTQYEQAPLFFLHSCEGLPESSCEVIESAAGTLVYQYLDPTEQLDWTCGSHFCSLFRNAGEPGKVYRQELLNVVEGWK